MICEWGIIYKLTLIVNFIFVIYLKGVPHIEDYRERIFLQHLLRNGKATFSGWVRGVALYTLSLILLISIHIIHVSRGVDSAQACNLSSRFWVNIPLSFLFKTTRSLTRLGFLSKCFSWFTVDLITVLSSFISGFLFRWYPCLRLEVKELCLTDFWDGVGYWSYQLVRELKWSRMVELKASYQLIMVFISSMVS